MTVLIKRTDRRHDRFRYNRMAGNIGIGNLICGMRYLENFKLIDIMRLQHFVAKIQFEIPVLDTFETQFIYVPCLERGSNAVGK